MRGYVKAKVKTTQGNRIVWAKKSESRGKIYLWLLDKYGKELDHIMIGFPQDIIWQHPAHLNLKYDVLETCNPNCTCDNFGNYRGDL